MGVLRRGATSLGFLLPAGAFLLTVAVLLPHARIRIDPHHDGVVLKPAVDVVSGQVLYRDTFSQYGPLSTYIPALFMLVLGKGLLAARIGTVLIQGGATALLTATWRQFLPTPLVLLSLALWLAFFPFLTIKEGPFLAWSSSYALFFQALALYAMARLVKSGSPGRWAVLCGMASALVLWCRFPVGVCLIAALLVCLALLSARQGRWSWKVGRLPAFLAGNCAVHAAFLLHLAANGALRDCYEQTVAWPMRWAAAAKLGDDLMGSRLTSSGSRAKAVKAVRDLINTHNIRLSFAAHGIRLRERHITTFQALIIFALVPALVLALRRPGGVDRPPDRLSTRDLPLLAVLACSALWLRWALVDRAIWAFVIPAVVLALTSAALWGYLRARRAGSDAREAALYLGCGAVSLASWTQYYPMSESTHQFFALSPAFGVFALGILRLGRGRSALVAAALGIVSLPLLADRWAGAEFKLSQDYRTLGGRSVLGGMRVSPTDAARWEALLDAIERYAKDYPHVAIQNETIDPLYAALGPDTRNPTPFHARWEGLPFPPDFDRERERFILERRPLIMVEAEGSPLQSADTPKMSKFINEYHYTILAKFVDDKRDIWEVDAPFVRFLLRPEAAK